MVAVNNYTRVRYGNTETVQAHQRGDARTSMTCESGPYFSERQMRIMDRK